MNNEEFLIDTTSYALHNLDIKMKKYLNYKNGFFIECGANDGVLQSNSKIFEDLMDWKGILIEPSYDSYLKCVENRKSKVYNCCLVADDSINQILGDFNGSLMSSVNGLRLNSNNLMNVKCRTLTSILDENNVKEIDFFSLDVEGYELEVLKGLDFSKYSPKYILVEITNKSEEKKEFNDILNFLTEKNYNLIDNHDGNGISNFNKLEHPGWDGTHNDYLFEINKSK